MKTKHESLTDRVVDEFLRNNFIVETEKRLPLGKGAVDIAVQKKDLKIYIEVKSSPDSINSRKVLSQLTRYQTFFGKEGIYCLVSPNSSNNPKIQSLDHTINGELSDFLYKLGI